MKKEDIDIKKILNGMTLNMNVLKEEDLKDTIIFELKDCVDFYLQEIKEAEYEDEKKEIDKNIKKIKQAIEELVAENDIDNMYNIYIKTLEPSGTDAQEFYKKIKKQKNTIERLESLALAYMKIIKCLNCEFEINYSRKSPSIYLKTEILVNEENISDFSYLDLLNFYFENTYDEEDYNKEKIEIRLSDHDFGGRTEIDEYGINEISYKKNCLNYVYKF